MHLSLCRMAESSDGGAPDPSAGGTQPSSSGAQLDPLVGGLPPDPFSCSSGAKCISCSESLFTPNQTICYECGSLQRPPPPQQSESTSLVQERKRRHHPTAQVDDQELSASKKPHSEAECELEQPDPTTGNADAELLKLDIKGGSETSTASTTGGVEDEQSKGTADSRVAKSSKVKP